MENADRPEGSRGARRRRRGVVFIDAERCKGCGYCVEFCPTHVLALSEAFNHKGYHPPEVVDADACSGCDLCGMYCPDFAIFGVKLRKIKDDASKAEAA